MGISLKSDKNSGAEPGAIFRSKRTPSGNDLRPLIDIAGIGKRNNAKRNKYNSFQNKVRGVAKKVGQQYAQRFGVPKRASGLAIDTAFKVEAIRRKVILYTILAIIFLLFFGFDLTGMNQQQTQLLEQQQGQTNPLQVSVVCTPSEVEVGKQSVCTITVVYPGSADDIQTVATIYPHAEYVKGSANHNGVYTTNPNTVTWDAQQENLPLANPISLTYMLTVTKTIDLAGVPITVNAIVDGGTAGGNVSANHNNCGGEYTLNNPLGNFGDPQCNFTRQGLGTEETELDSAHKYTWDCIARYESGGGTGYDPNAFNGNSTSGKGAYGLFQMNPPGEGNNQYDNGGVNWPAQLSNAVNYNKGLGGTFGYWGTYYTNGGPCH